MPLRNILDEIARLGINPAEFVFSSDGFMKAMREAEESSVGTRPSPTTFFGLPFSIDPALPDDVVVVDNGREKHTIRF